MRVAIIGGGFSGLACAHELERHGVKPVIFEKKSFMGEPYSHVTAILEITHRPIKDALKYFKNSMNIDIKPLNTINTLIHNAPNNKTAVVKGNLGYLLKNTSESDSAKGQLFNSLKNTEIRFNEIGDYEKLSKEFDNVVIATGNYSAAQESGIWQEWFKAHIRGAVVQGDFDPQTLTMWLNKDYFKNGYAYMTPFSNHKAVIILIVSDVNEKEIDHYWELFLDAENIKYTIIEEFKQEHRAGFVYPRTYNNIIFIGNAAGVLDPFLGFGHFNSIVTGVSAARTIVIGLDYEKQIKSIVNRNIDMRQFRKMYNTMTNKGYNKLVTAIGLPGLKYLLYSFPLNINVIKIGSIASKFILNEKIGR